MPFEQCPSCPSAAGRLALRQVRLRCLRSCCWRNRGRLLPHSALYRTAGYGLRWPVRATHRRRDFPRIAGDEAAFRLVDAHLVTKLGSFGELAFLDRLASVSKKLTIRSAMIRWPETPYLACSSSCSVSATAA